MVQNFILLSFVDVFKDESDKHSNVEQTHRPDSEVHVEGTAGHREPRHRRQWQVLVSVWLVILFLGWSFLNTL